MSEYFYMDSRLSFKERLKNYDNIFSVCDKICFLKCLEALFADKKNVHSPPESRFSKCNLHSRVLVVF